MRRWLNVWLRALWPETALLLGTAAGLGLLLGVLIGGWGGILG